MKVHHLNCATMCARLPDFVLGGPLVSHVLLIETPRDGLIAVDTGFGTDDVRAPLTRLGPMRLVIAPRLSLQETLLHQVKALGYAASDVRHVIPTHLDLDHAGGLADFPHAKVHLMASEVLAATQRRTFRHKLRYRAAHWAHDPAWVRHEVAGDSWKGFEAVRPLPGMDDAIHLVPLYGHTPGHAGVAVRQGDGWLLHAGDAYFDPSEVQAGGGAAPGLAAFKHLAASDEGLRKHNVRRLRVLKQAHPEVTVFCAHSRVELASVTRPD